MPSKGSIDSAVVAGAATAGAAAWLDALQGVVGLLSVTVALLLGSVRLAMALGEWRRTRKGGD